MQQPMHLDFKAIADAVIRNNMGVGGIELRVRGAMNGAEVALAGTGQRLPVTGGPTSTDRPWLVFEVEGWEPDAAMSLAWVGQQDGP